MAKDYLEQCCKQANGRYQNVRYDNKRDAGVGPCFCNAADGSFRKRMTNVLLQNQNGYCCYCMRKIKIGQREEYSDKVVTREHIIPRGFSHADVAKLAYYQQCPELSNSQVILTDDFEDTGHNQTDDLPPYPHKIAYNNLVASCNGTFPYVRNRNENKPKICCNEYRHEEDAYPVYFIKGIEGMIDYLDNGDIHVKCGVSTDNQQKIEDVIRNTHLACDQLRDIRHLWFILSHVSKDRIYNCKTEGQRDALLSEILYKDEFFEGNRTSNLHTNFQKDDFWQTFLLYDYFYDVFHNAK